MLRKENVLLHPVGWGSNLWYRHLCWNFESQGLHLHQLHWHSGMGSFSIRVANLVGEILLAEATVDFGRLEIYIDHVWERDWQSDRSQEE